MDAYRAWADVDLDALTRNLAVIRNAIGDKVEVMLVVKADAYGHGAVAIAHHATRAGVTAFGVGTSTEALELRHGGICAPILVLGTIVDEEVVACLHHDIHIGLHSMNRCRTLQAAARRQGRIARVHLNIDTGMGRLGVLPERAVELLREIQAASHLELAGIMTHISSPKGDSCDGIASQTARFESVLADARAEDLVSGWVHMSNSAGLFSGTSPLYDCVRVGISAYGVVPKDATWGSDLDPVMSLRTRIIFLKDLPAGSTVGYDGTWTAMGKRRIATLPVGYNDGVPWRLSNQGEVLVRGQRAPIVGRVSMDYTTIDVTDIKDVNVDDVATLIGSDGDENLLLRDVAKCAETIPYEIACSIGKRVARVFRTPNTPGTSTCNQKRDSGEGEEDAQDTADESLATSPR
jgi:alanine racemase